MSAREDADSDAWSDAPSAFRALFAPPEDAGTEGAPLARGEALVELATLALRAIFVRRVTRS